MFFPTCQQINSCFNKRSNERTSTFERRTQKVVCDVVVVVVSVNTAATNDDTRRGEANRRRRESLARVAWRGPRDSQSQRRAYTIAITTAEFVRAGLLAAKQKTTTHSAALTNAKH